MQTTSCQCPSAPTNKGCYKNKPKMAYSHDALLENSKRQDYRETREGLERNQRETREKLERYGAMEDGL